jgi:Protein of unknown function (DUF2924)
MNYVSGRHTQLSRSPRNSTGCSPIRGDGNDTPELSATPLPRAGTILIREWHGITHHVTVTEDGFLWNGKPHRSLSSIARAITGTAWNGPRFFGLREVNSRTPENRHGG